MTKSRSTQEIVRNTVATIDDALAVIKEGATAISGRL
jgi:hypothetical protein